MVNKYPLQKLKTIRPRSHLTTQWACSKTLQKRSLDVQVKDGKNGGFSMPLEGSSHLLGPTFSLALQLACLFPLWTGMHAPLFRLAPLPRTPGSGTAPLAARLHLSGPAGHTSHRHQVPGACLTSLLSLESRRMCAPMSLPLLACSRLWSGQEGVRSLGDGVDGLAGARGGGKRR